ncbi:MAG TPA: molybdopterin-dependent oxidoreductase, partial [Spirochaetales bacterium]|nr:molybdopterin-dependent oxidoreductase [Spirochaetales bacterium]
MRPDTAFRNDARAKVTGRATYADDISIAGMLHAAPVYADYVSAKDLVIDAAEALASPGCVRVITAADVPGSARFGQIEKDYPIFCSGRVRSYGDVCALVVAETRAAAKAAAALVRVTATPVRPVLTIDEALEPGAPVVPSYGETNVVTHHRLRHGDPESVFAGCELVLEEEFSTQAIEHAYMEPETAVCVPRSDGVVEV